MGSLKGQIQDDVHAWVENEPECLTNGNYLLACVDYESETIAYSNLNTTTPPPTKLA